MRKSNERQTQILNAAAAVIIRLGYDKTSMSDIAEEAGASRGTIYVYFKSKEELFEALIAREWMLYAENWLASIEADPRGGTVGGFYRATLHAMNSRPLVASMMRRDRRVIGSYLRKPDNLFAFVQSTSTADFIRAMQAAGAIRRDVDPLVIGHIIDLISYGQLTLEDFKPLDQFPPDDQVLEAIADMMDRLLTPEDGGDSAAGKALIRQIVAAARDQLEQIKQAKAKTRSEAPL